MIKSFCRAYGGSWVADITLPRSARKEAFHFIELSTDKQPYSAVPGSILSGLISTVVGHSARHPLAVGEGVETTAQLLAWAEAMPMCEVSTKRVHGRPLKLVYITPAWKKANNGSRNDSLCRALIGSGVILLVPETAYGMVGNNNKRRKVDKVGSDSQVTPEDSADISILMNLPPTNADVSKNVSFMTVMNRVVGRLGSRPTRLYMKECPEGDDVAVCWSQRLESWVLHSRNLSLVVKDAEDLFKYSGRKRNIAAAWLEQLTGKNLTLLRQLLGGCTLFGSCYHPNRGMEPLSQCQPESGSFTWYGLTVNTVAPASPCVDPKRALRLMRFCGLLEGNGIEDLSAREITDSGTFVKALREIYFSGVPNSVTDSDKLIQCEYAKTALFLCAAGAAEEEEEQVIMADFSETAKFRILNTMRLTLARCAMRGLGVDSELREFERRCRIMLGDPVGSSYALEAYVGLLKKIEKVAKREDKWRERDVKEQFVELARLAVEVPDEGGNLVVLIHAPPGVIPSGLLTRTTEVTSVEAIMEMVESGGRHVARMRDITVMGSGGEKLKESVRVVSVGWEGTVDDVITRSFEKAGRMDLCEADIEFFEMDPEAQVEEIGHCYEAARGVGDWVLTASSVEELPGIMEGLGNEPECRIVLIDAPPGSVPHKLITDDVAVNAETLGTIRKTGGKHVLYAPGWTGGVAVDGVFRIGWDQSLVEVLEQARQQTTRVKARELLLQEELRFASGTLEEQRSLIEGWWDGQKESVTDAWVVETVPNQLQLIRGITSVLRGERPTTRLDKSAVGAGEDGSVSDADDEALLSADNSVGPTLVVEEAPIVGAEIVDDSTSPDTIMNAVQEGSIGGSVLECGPGCCTEIPASPISTVPSTPEVEESLEVVTSRGPKVAVTPIEASMSSSAVEARETEKRGGTVVIIHAPPGVVPRELLTDDGVSGERQIQQLLEDGDDRVVHACTVSFLFRFKFQRDRVAVVNYGWEGAIQEVIGRTLAHAGDENKSKQDEVFFRFPMSKQGGLFAKWYQQASKKIPRGVKTASPGSEKALREAVQRMLGERPRSSRTIFLVVPMGLPGSGSSELLEAMFDKIEVKKGKFIQGKNRTESGQNPEAVVSNAALIKARDFARKGAFDSTALGAALRRASGDFVQHKVRRSKQESKHVVFLDMNHTDIHSIKTSARNFMVNGVDVRVVALFMAEIAGTTEVASWKYPWSPQAMLTCLKRELSSHGNSEGFDSRMTEQFFELCRELAKYKCPQTSRLISEVRRVPIIEPGTVVDIESASRGLEQLGNVKGSFSEEELQLADHLAGMVEGSAEIEPARLDSLCDDILRRLISIISEP